MCQKNSEQQTNNMVIVENQYIKISNIRVFYYILTMKKDKNSFVKRNKFGKSAILQLVTPQQENLQISSSKVTTPVRHNNNYESNYQYDEKQQLNQGTEITEDENQKLTDMVSKLFSKNKISSKNAFQIPLVNINDLRSYHSQDQGSWSKMSSTLENSSRIYGYRVDSVNQNIIKMTNNISRSMIMQNTQYKQNDVMKIVAVKIEDKYDSMDLQQHLDKDKLKQQKFMVEERCSFGDKKMRRMLDQNGVSGLILANVGISHTLCLNLHFDQAFNQKVQIEKPHQNQINLPKLILDESGLNIFNQIYNRCQNILIQKQSKFKQNYEVVFSNLNNENILNNFSDEMDQAQLQPDIDSNDQRSFYFISLVQDNQPLKRQMPSNSVSRYIKKKQNVEKKKKKNSIKKSKKQSKMREKAEQDKYLMFDSQIVLKKETVLKAKINKKLENQSQNLHNFDKNTYIIDDRFSIFHLQVHLEVKQTQTSTFKNDQNEQTHMNIDHFECSNTNELQVGLISIDLSTERDFKCPSIKQTKQQILTILSPVNQIKFSKLYEEHKRMVQNSSQAIDFVSVLHLCNELNLNITQIDSYDFLIQR